MSELLPRSRNDHQHGEEPLQGSPETATVFDRDAATTRRNKMLRNVAAFTLGGVLLSGVGYAFGNRGGDTVEKAPAVATAPANPDVETAPAVTPEATPTPLDIEAFRETFPYQTVDEEGNVTKYGSRDEFIEAMRVPAVDPDTGKEISGEEALKMFVGRFNIQLNTAADVPTHKAYRSFEDSEDPSIPAGAEAIAEGVYNNAFNEALYYKEGADVGFASTLATNHRRFVAAFLANTDDVAKGQNKLTAKYTYANTTDEPISEISAEVKGLKAYYAGNVRIRYTDTASSDIAAQRAIDKQDNVDENGNVDKTYVESLSLRTIKLDNGEEVWLIDGSHS